MRVLCAVLIPALALLNAPIARAAGGADRGETIYKVKCVKCHGANGSGQTDMGKSVHAKDLRTKLVQSQSDTDLKNTVMYGQNQMPAFTGRLDDQQLDDVISYVRTLGNHKKK